MSEKWEPGDGKRDGMSIAEAIEVSGTRISESIGTLDASRSTVNS